jgi:ubiquinol-cytochrome c reductase subunit 7
MSQPSLYNAITKRPWAMRLFKPLANWYVNAAGYRKLGLR